MATPFTPTPAQEMLGIEHPFYEMDQMIFCASALRGEPDVFVPQVGFALAESFVIHARSLLHFFFDDHKRKPTDLLAGDFVVNPTAWRGAYPAPSKLLEDFKIRVDTEVAHVTTLRKVGQPPQKTWDVNAILSELTNTMKDFLDHATHPPGAGSAPPSPPPAMFPGALGSSSTYPPLSFGAGGATGPSQSCTVIAEVIRKL
jgi:hypothetical protein